MGTYVNVIVKLSRGFSMIEVSHTHHHIVLNGSLSDCQEGFHIIIYKLVISCLFCEHK